MSTSTMLRAAINVAGILPVSAIKPRHHEPTIRLLDLRVGMTHPETPAVASSDSRLLVDGAGSSESGRVRISGGLDGAPGWTPPNHKSCRTAKGPG